MKFLISLYRHGSSDSASPPLQHGKRTTRDQLRPDHEGKDPLWEGER
jgi:hypothetical protein